MMVMVRKKREKPEREPLDTVWSAVLGLNEPGREHARAHNLRGGVDTDRRSMQRAPVGTSKIFALRHLIGSRAALRAPVLDPCSSPPSPVARNGPKLPPPRPHRGASNVRSTLARRADFPLGVRSRMQRFIQFALRRQIGLCACTRRCAGVGRQKGPNGVFRTHCVVSLVNSSLALNVA